MRNKLALTLLAFIYVGATGLTWTTFRRYPDQSGTVVVQWLLLYTATVLYPIVWTLQGLRLLRKLGLEQSHPLLRQAWGPVIVGGTSLLMGLSLLSPLLRR